MNWCMHIVLVEFICLTFVIYIWVLAAIVVKEKLESLCREFQRQNKTLKVCSVYLNFESKRYKRVLLIFIQLLYHFSIFVSGRVPKGIDGGTEHAYGIV
jgi:hypothetical protein